VHTTDAHLQFSYVQAAAAAAAAAAAGRVLFIGCLEMVEVVFINFLARFRKTFKSLPNFSKN